MIEMPRAGMPNLIGQGEQVARARGAISGAEQAASESIAASLRDESLRQAEQLPRAGSVEALVKDRQHGQEEQGEPGEEREAAGEEGPDDEGHLVDLVA